MVPQGVMMPSETSVNSYLFTIIWTRNIITDGTYLYQSLGEKFKINKILSINKISSANCIKTVTTEF